jgi:membrane protease YdiL (CAAX protease family)
MDNQPESNSLRDRFGALLRDNRLAIAVELLVVILLVTRMRNASLLLLLIGWLSLWLRRSGWKNIGMSRPLNWQNTILAGIGIGILYQLFSISVLVPVLHRLTNASLDLSSFEALRGNVTQLALWLVVAWTFAAFGEEMAYRGYFLNRIADLFGRTNFGWGSGIVISSVFFGLVHRYQGINGVIETFIFGGVMACLYTISKRNLWLPIIVHGVIDTVGFLLIFFNLYP